MACDKAELRSLMEQQGATPAEAEQSQTTQTKKVAPKQQIIDAVLTSGEIAELHTYLDAKVN